MTLYLIMQLGELRTSLKAHFLSLDSMKKIPLFNKHKASLGNNMQNFKIAHTTKYRDIWLLERTSEYSSNVTPIAHHPSNREGWLSLRLQFFLSRFQESKGRDCQIYSECKIPLRLFVFSHVAVFNCALTYASTL